LNDSKLLKIWLAYPLFYCTCILISVLQWLCFWHGSRWCWRWICGWSLGMSSAIKHSLNFENKLEMFCNYVLVEFWDRFL